RWCSRNATLAARCSDEPFARSQEVLAEAGGAADGARRSGGGAVAAKSGTAGAKPGIAHRASAVRFGQPWPAALHRSCRLVRRENSERSQSFAAISVVVVRGNGGRRADLLRSMCAARGAGT